MGEYRLLITILCIVGSLLQGLFIYSEYKRNMRAAVCLKGTASLIFVSIGFIGYTVAAKAGQTNIPRLILFGLILGAIGDILLNLRYLAGKKKTFFFIAGTVSFFMGHMMYLAALFILSDNIMIPVIAGIIVTIVAEVIAGFKTIAPIHFKILGGLYIAAVVFMACMAVNNAIECCSTGRILFAVGAVLFLISDMVLILNTFGKEPKMFWSGICLTLYYPGQLLIALAAGFLI